MEQLTNTWKNIISSTTRAGTRNIDAGSGWLPVPKGYVLIAACRPSESTYEYAFEGSERNGAPLTGFSSH